MRATLNDALLRPQSIAEIARLLQFEDKLIDRQWENCRDHSSRFQDIRSGFETNRLYAGRTQIGGDFAILALIGTASKERAYASPDSVAFGVSILEPK